MNPYDIIFNPHEVRRCPDCGQLFIVYQENDEDAECCPDCTFGEQEMVREFDRMLRKEY